MEDLVRRVIPAVVAAGRIALSFYDEGVSSVSFKSDDSPVTSADRAVHEFLVASLAPIDEACTVVSEESATGHDPAGRSPRFWLVDPLDGTKEFIKRSGEFTVNVALIDEAVPVLGVVYAPAIDELYWAVRRRGAWRSRHTGSSEERIHAAAHASNPPRIIMSRDHVSDDDRALLQRIGEHQLISAGSSLKFCRVAAGEADLYPRFAGTMEWDTAAAQCIAEEAGAVVVDAGNRPIRYGKPALRNPPLFCYADADIWRSAWQAA